MPTSGSAAARADRGGAAPRRRTVQFRFPRAAGGRRRTRRGQAWRSRGLQWPCAAKPPAGRGPRLRDRACEDMRLLSDPGNRLCRAADGTGSLPNEMRSLWQGTGRPSGQARSILPEPMRGRGSATCVRRRGYEDEGVDGKRGFRAIPEADVFKLQIVGAGTARPMGTRRASVPPSLSASRVLRACFAGGLVVPYGGQFAQRFERRQGQAAGRRGRPPRIEAGCPCAETDLAKQRKADIDRDQRNAERRKELENRGGQGRRSSGPPLSGSCSDWASALSASKQWHPRHRGNGWLRARAGDPAESRLGRRPPASRFSLAAWALHPMRAMNTGMRGMANRSTM